MKTNIRTYLKFYLGCKIQIQNHRVDNLIIGTLDEINTDMNDITSYSTVASTHSIDNIKLILTHPNDITDAQVKQLFQIIFGVAPKNMVDARNTCELYLLDELNAEGFIWALKNHFDIFGLIDAGLAIDKKSLKNKKK